jgi:putative ABC transport system permease protein
MPGPDRRPGAGELVLLALCCAALWVAWSLLQQPAFQVRTGAEGALPLSVAPLAVDGGVWGDGTAGPGAAYAAAERLLLILSAGALLLVALAAGLGQTAAAGVRAVARRGELRLRRALGATRRQLLRGELRGAAGVLLLAVPAGLAVGWGMAGGARGLWEGAGALPAPLLALAGTSLTLALISLAAWGVFSFVVVVSGEALPGRPLDRDAVLAEPFRGEVCHPAVPVLQIAIVSGAVTWAGALALEVDGGAALHPAGVALHARAAPASAERVLVDLHAADEATRVQFTSGAMFGGAVSGATPPAPLSLTSVGFWEGVGHVRYAETECGICWRPGNPPVLAPLKGEPAVHHAVNPDTFPMAGITVLQGRAFTAEDGPDSEAVAVVSRAFAAEHFQDGEALGRRVRIGPRGERWHTVVGVIEALPRPTLAARRQPAHDVLVPVAQLRPRQVEMATGEPGSLEPRLAGLVPLAAAVHPLPSVQAGLARVSAWSGGYLALLRWLAVGALLVAAAGIVLTIARRVRETAPEIALRRAMGATRQRLAVGHLASGLRMGTVGSLAGAWLALVPISVLAPELFRQPGTLAGLALPVLLLFPTLTAATAGLTALWAMRGPPKQGMEG